MTAGLYPVRITVTDNGVPAEKTDGALVLEVIDTAPSLSATQDTDGDGVSDIDEGYGDSDKDGIANYLDPSAVENVIPEIAGNTKDYLIETEAGLGLRLGEIAFAAGTNGALVDTQDIALSAGMEDASDSWTNVGGLFDFEVSDLSHAGQSVKLVIPLLDPIPAKPIYRKWSHNTWRSFVQNERNALSSAPGAPGFCPPPGDSAFTSGLTPGHLCMQITIEDGGPNDSDNSANALICDPGGIVQGHNSGGGGGGCSVNPNSSGDFILKFSLLSGLVYLWRRRRFRRS